MILDCTNLKEDLEEKFLENSQEEIGQTDIEDICFENILDNVIGLCDYEYMEDYIRDHIDSFDINENDTIISKLAVHLVEEELPIVRNEILEETEDLIEDFIEQQQENRINSLYVM